MATKNPNHRLNSKESFWEYHVKNWAQTTLTQVQYCKNQGLAENTFSRWKKKLEAQIPKTTTSKKLIPLGRASKCSFCGVAEKKSRKIFYGANNTVSICDKCLWWKSNELQLDDKMYAAGERDECLICLKSKGGQRTIGGKYRICNECLDGELFGIYLFHPEKLPCKHHCIGCYTKREKVEHYMVLGKHHILCNKCINVVLKKVIENRVVPANICWFCGKAISEDKCKFVGRLPLCRQCSEEMSKKISTTYPVSNKVEELSKVKCDYCNAVGDVALMGNGRNHICLGCLNDALSVLNAEMKEDQEKPKASPKCDYCDSVEDATLIGDEKNHICRICIGKAIELLFSSAAQNSVLDFDPRVKCDFCNATKEQGLVGNGRNHMCRQCLEVSVKVFNEYIEKTNNEN